MEKRLLLMLLCFLFCLCTSRVSASDQHYGIAYAQDRDLQSSHSHYCISYNPSFQKLPTSKQDAKLLPLHDMTPDVLCSDPDHEDSMSGNVVAVSRGNCTFSEKAYIVQKHGGKTAFIVSSTGLIEPAANQTEDYDNINITVAMIRQEDFTSMKALGKNIMVLLYAPLNSRVDYNLIVIWLIALFTVTVGAYWSGIKKHGKYLRKKQAEMDEDLRGDQSKDKEQDDDADSLDVTPTTVLVFVVLMCGMLLGLYFFYDYLVYVIIGLFTLGSSLALYSCIAALLESLPIQSPCCARLSCKVPYVSQRLEVRRVILALLCLGIGIFWAVERNASYAWILQNILGISFCLNMMKTIHMPNLKACTILLALLFVYDIFFVFITPLFTKTGESVMVEVATGHSSHTGEQLPMVVKVPHFQNFACLNFSMLGYGDILVPGLLVSFCHGFDLKVQSGRIYYIVTSIAYGVGLVLTFVALALMQTGQPALLYLVPCTLVPTFLIGCCRKEVTHLWKGNINDQRPRQVVVENSAEGKDEVADVGSDDVEQQQLLINR